MENAGNFARTNSSPTAKLDKVAVPEVTSKGALTFPRVPLALVLVDEVGVLTIEDEINVGVILLISSYHPFAATFAVLAATLATFLCIALTPF